MQREIDAAAIPGTDSGIQILGINEAGQESGNAGMVQGRVLPWLQDTPQEHVWGGRWQIEWRDVVVLDAQNRRIAVYNLTLHDLNDPANYAELRDLLLAAANPTSRATANSASKPAADPASTGRAR